MTDEVVLAALVREWAEGALPGQPAVADAAAGLALRRYAGGASVTDACDEARRFVQSWARHPSRWQARRDRRPRVAS